MHNETRYSILTTIYDKLTTSTVLFEKKTKKVIRYTWMAFGILIIVSMVLFFAPGLIPGAGHGGIGF